MLSRNEDIREELSRLHGYAADIRKLDNPQKLEELDRVIADTGQEIKRVLWPESPFLDLKRKAESVSRSLPLNQSEAYTEWANDCSRKNRSRNLLNFFGRLPPNTIIPKKQIFAEIRALEPNMNDKAFDVGYSIALSNFKLKDKPEEIFQIRSAGFAKYEMDIKEIEVPIEAKRELRANSPEALILRVSEHEKSLPPQDSKKVADIIKRTNIKLSSILSATESEKDEAKKWIFENSEAGTQVQQIMLVIAEHLNEELKVKTITHESGLDFRNVSALLGANVTKRFLKFNCPYKLAYLRSGVYR
ncbi:MAG: hypothetical protein AAB540_00470, partial [Patescibacteria group bacterium]